LCVFCAAKPRKTHTTSPSYWFKKLAKELLNL
jgi:hypothetical protein